MEVANAKAAEREAVGHFLACKEMSLSLFVHFFFIFFLGKPILLCTVSASTLCSAEQWGFEHLE